jgi:hypothetical protein
MNEKYILYTDTLGRLLIGKEHSRKESIISIKNPAIIHAIHKEGGGLQITVIPIVFREFLADKDEPIIFDYTETSINIAQNPILDARIMAQYEQMYAPLKDVIQIPKVPQSNPANAATSNVAQNKPNIIKLFDE